jgi:hypothetical protein
MIHSRLFTDDELKDLEPVSFIEDWCKQEVMLSPSKHGGRASARVLRQAQDDSPAH